MVVRKCLLHFQRRVVYYNTQKKRNAQQCRGGHQIACADPAAGAVTEHEPGPRSSDAIQMDSRRPMRRLHIEHVHAVRMTT